MKLSTRSRYALEGMLYLAAFGQDRPVPVKEVAEGTCISMAYLEQIFYAEKVRNYVYGARQPRRLCTRKTPE